MRRLSLQEQNFVIFMLQLHILTPTKIFKLSVEKTLKLLNTILFFRNNSYPDFSGLSVSKCALT
jgi:hypothetical protein